MRKNVATPDWRIRRTVIFNWDSGGGKVDDGCDKEYEKEGAESI